MKASPQSSYHKIKKALCVCGSVSLIALLHLLQVPPPFPCVCVCLCLSVCVITLISLHTTAIAAGFAKLTLERW